MTRLRLLFDVRGDLLAAARQCEADVFLDRFANTPEQLAEAYGRYESATCFLAAVDPGGRVAGTLRLILPGPAGLPTLTDLALPPWSLDPARAAALAGLDPARTLDGTTMAVRPGQREQGFAVSYALLHGMIATMRAHALTGVVSMLDAVPLRLVTATGLIFEPLPGAGARPYFGSAATTPAFALLAPMLARQRRLEPTLNQAIEHGIGLAGVKVDQPASAGLTGAACSGALGSGISPAAQRSAHDRTSSAGIGRAMK